MYEIPRVRNFEGHSKDISQVSNGIIKSTNNVFGTNVRTEFCIRTA